MIGGSHDKRRYVLERAVSLRSVLAKVDATNFIAEGGGQRVGFNFLASGSHGIFLSRCKCYSAKRQEIRPNTPITAKKAAADLDRHATGTVSGADIKGDPAIGDHNDR